MKRTLVAVLMVLGAALRADAADLRNEITPENIVRLMNVERRAEGLPPLVLEPRVVQAAADRMQQMTDEAFWSHESPDGLKPFAWLRVRAYDYERAGENLASGFETARLLVASWMESPGHRANILSPEFQDCGVAVIEGSTLGPSPGKSVVVLFGKARTWVAASAK